MESEPRESRRRLLNRRLLLFSSVLFALFLLDLVSLNLLVPLDSSIHSWVQEHRTCGLDRAASILKDWTTTPYATAVLVLAVAGILAYRRRWQDLGSFFIITVGAALLNEWVKEFVSRARPSALSFVDYGNSFPSGHATSAVAILGAIYYLSCPSLLGNRWKRFVGMVIVTASVVMIGCQRVYFTHHWSSDVIGGLLLGWGWLLFVLAALHGSIEKKSLLRLGGAFGTAFLVLWLVPGYRLNVASPTTFRSIAANQIDLTAYSPDTIEPRERRLGKRRLPQTIWRFLKANTAIDLTLAQGTNYLLIFAARPWIPSRQHVCRQVDFSFNGRPLKTLILMDGWRDYQIPIAGRWVSSGKNQLTIHFDNDVSDSLLFTNLEVHVRALDG